MKAVKIIRPGVVKLCEIPEPEVGPEDVLIKLRALGLCGSDLKTYRGQNPFVSYPRIPGHEIAGEIVHLGSNVPASFKPGSLVTVYPYTACGNCSACRIGRVNCCQYNETLGIQRDGAAVEFFTIHHSKILSIDGLEDEQIALIEPLSVGMHAANRAMVKEEDTVLIFGCGVIGLGSIAASVYRGARVIAVDIDETKLEKADALGAEYTVNSNREDLNQMVEKITDAHGPDVVIEAVGLNETYRKAVDLVCFAGRVVYIGYTKEPVEFETTLFISKEIDIKGSRNALNSEMKEIIEIFHKGKINVLRFITQRFKLCQIGEALRFWDENPKQVTKILIECY